MNVRDFPSQYAPFIEAELNRIAREIAHDLELRRDTPPDGIEAYTTVPSDLYDRTRVGSLYTVAVNVPLEFVMQVAAR